MTQAKEHEALVEACADRIHTIMCAAHFASDSRNPSLIATIAERKEYARAVLAVIAEKAKEWPTEGMKKSYWASDVNAWRAMFAISPIVKPE